MTAYTSRMHTAVFYVLAYAVALHGLVMIASTLEEQLHVRFTRHLLHVSGFVFDVPILFGLSLLYLSMLLRRGKRLAWAVTTGLYGIILVFGLVQFGVARH